MYGEGNEHMVIFSLPKLVCHMSKAHVKNINKYIIFSIEFLAALRSSRSLIVSPSVGRLVGWSVGRLVGWLVARSVGPSSFVKK